MVYVPTASNTKFRIAKLFYFIDALPVLKRGRELGLKMGTLLLDNYFCVEKKSRHGK
jgi:hypothetical protein